MATKTGIPRIAAIVKPNNKDLAVQRHKTLLNGFQCVEKAGLCRHQRVGAEDMDRNETDNKRM